jgi:hypothetical protein
MLKYAAPNLASPQPTYLATPHPDLALALWVRYLGRSKRKKKNPIKIRISNIRNSLTINRGIKEKVA